MEYHFCGCVDSDLKQIKYFINERLEELTEYIRDEAKLFELKLIFNELIINGAIHGNDLCLDKLVHLYIDLSETEISIKVIDEGSGFELCLNDYRPEDMHTGGRGLILVNGLVDELVCKRNTVKAIMKLWL